MFSYKNVLHVNYDLNVNDSVGALIRAKNQDRYNK